MMRKLPISMSLSDDALLSLAKVCGFDEIAKYNKIWDDVFNAPDLKAINAETVFLKPANKRLIVNGLLSAGVTHAKIESGKNGCVFPVWGD